MKKKKRQADRLLKAEERRKKRNSELGQGTARYIQDTKWPEKNEKGNPFLVEGRGKITFNLDCKRKGGRLTGVFPCFGEK